MITIAEEKFLLAKRLVYLRENKRISNILDVTGLSLYETLLKVCVEIKTSHFYFNMYDVFFENNSDLEYLSNINDLSKCSFYIMDMKLILNDLNIKEVYLKGDNKNIFKNRLGGIVLPVGAQKALIKLVNINYNNKNKLFGEQLLQCLLLQEGYKSEKFKKTISPVHVGLTRGHRLNVFHKRFFLIKSVFLSFRLGCFSGYLYEVFNAYKIKLVKM